MSKQNIKESLDESADSQLPANPNLWPTIRQRLNPRFQPKNRNLLRLTTVGLAASLIIIIALVAVPSLTPKPNPTSYNAAILNPTLAAAAHQITLASQDDQFNQDQLESDRQIISKRLNLLGIDQFSVNLISGGFIQIQTGSVPDPAQLQQTVSKTGRIEFVDAGSDTLTYGQLIQTSYCTSGSLYQPKPNLCHPLASPTPTSTTKIYQTVITGDQLDQSQIQQSTDSNGTPIIEFGVKPEAAKTLSDFTTHHIGQYMAIVLDGKVISSANIQGTISDKGQITNPSSWSTPEGRQEFNYIVIALKTGALPLNLQSVPAK